MLETSLKEVITAYRNLSFCDRTAFYYSVSNDVDVSESNLQVFLFKTRLKEGSCCIYCEGEHIVKNGHRNDISAVTAKDRLFPPLFRSHPGHGKDRPCGPHISGV